MYTNLMANLPLMQLAKLAFRIHHKYQNIFIIPLQQCTFQNHHLLQQYVLIEAKYLKGIEMKNIREDAPLDCIAPY
ncbi:hypothetical protein pb186bvf_002553 [Paramecium bursaria]